MIPCWSRPSSVSIDTCRRGFRSYLRQDVVDLFADLSISAGQYSNQMQEFDLQEGVGDTLDIMLGSISGSGQTLQDLDQTAHHRTEHIPDAIFVVLHLVRLAQTYHQHQTTYQDAMVPVL